MTYEDFIQSKVKRVLPQGFEPVLPRNPGLFDWQTLLIHWGIRQGRAAFFESCGLGKTRQQIELEHNVCVKTDGPGLILAPLAVAKQTIREGEKIGRTITFCREAADVRDGINITNYDRIEKFENVQFSSVALDESSVLKNLTGKTFNYLTERFSGTPYRTCWTATPSPNDFTELGQHAAFLGICSPAQMLATYFINDTFDTKTWRLKKHAEADFWKWVASWAACISKPSDIGGSDEGFDLPPLNVLPIWVDVDASQGAADGELLRCSELSATNVNREMRMTIDDRVSKCVELMASKLDDSWAVWCNLNDEQDALALAFGDSCASVFGSLSGEEKEKRIFSWIDGEKRTLATKASIAGYGLNLQHCHEVIYFPNFSFEDFHQVTRRFWRFGQKNPVNVYVVLPKTAGNLLRTLNRKAANHDTMKELMKFTQDNFSKTQHEITMNTEIDTAKGDGWTMHKGDCVRALESKVKSKSIGFSIFSPPFESLFTYSSDVQDMGNCDGMESFMEQFGFLIDQLARVMMPGREVAVHCCDLLAMKWKDGDIEFKDFSGEISRAFRSRGFLFHSRICIWKDPVTEMQRTKSHGLLYKTLRKDSSKSRVGSADYLLVFRKRGENPEPVVHMPEDFPLSLWQEIASPVWMTIDQGDVLNGEMARDQKDERHICPLQKDVISRALRLWSNPGDLVLSPFAGIGSEGYGAIQAGRKFIGAELKESYFKTACDYLRKAAAEKEDLFSVSKTKELATAWNSPLNPVANLAIPEYVSHARRLA